MTLLCEDSKQKYELGILTHVWRRWRANGGDLEARRELAVTIITDEVQLLLVAPSVLIKEKVRCEKVVLCSVPCQAECASPRCHC